MILQYSLLSVSCYHSMGTAFNKLDPWGQVLLLEDKILKKKKKSVFVYYMYIIGDFVS